MSRTRRIILVAIAALLLLVLLLLTYCRDDLPPVTWQAPATIIVDHRLLYPGASIKLPFAPGEELKTEADHGAIGLAVHGTAYIYVAPIDVASDSFRIIDDKNGAAMLTGSVSVIMPPEATLEVVSIGDTGVEARYGGVSLTGELAGDVASANFSGGDPPSSLVVRIDGDGTGTLIFEDVELDGYGELTASEADALHALATGPLARAITMMPLDIGCAEHGERIPDQLYAALLLPWQMILKYEVAARTPVVSHFVEKSQCAFPGSPIDGAGKPDNQGVVWDVDHVVPSTLFFFPIDGAGQMERIGQ